MAMTVEENLIHDADPKSYTVAIQLIEATTKFISNTVSFGEKLEREIDEEDVHHELVQFVQDYEQVDMIINVVKSIYLFLKNTDQQQSMKNAANSATNSTFRALLKVYNLMLRNGCHNQKIRDIVEVQIFNLLSRNENFDASKQSHRGLQLMSTCQFLEGFELTANEFALKNNMHIDNVWESMFNYAVTPNRKEWVMQNLFNKNLTWAAAKQTYTLQYPDHIVPKPHVPKHTQQKPRHKSKSPRQQQRYLLHLQKLQHQQEMRELRQQQRQNQFRQKQQPQKKKVHLQNFQQSSHYQHKQHHQQQRTREDDHVEKSVSEPNVVIKEEQVEEQPQKELVLYAQVLLGLEMKVYDDIDSYNTKFLCYCKKAQMDLTDNALLRRYVNSLLEKYRNTVQNVITTSEKSIHHLVDLMSMTKKAIKSSNTF